jgi:predicted transcriptional regulator
MPPTTLKLPPQLRERIRAIVADTDESVHSFMLKAIEQETARAEQRKGFVTAALEARADFAKTSLGYEAHDVHAHMRARAAGKRSPRPKAKRWRG